MLYVLKCLDRVNGLFSTREMTGFINHHLVPLDVKTLIAAFKFVINLRVPHRQESLDDLVNKIILSAILSKTRVRDSLLLYFNAIEEWGRHIEKVSSMDNKMFCDEIDRLYNCVNIEYDALAKVVTETLQSQIIQECLATVQKIVNNASSALHDNDLIAQLKQQLQTIEDVIIAETIMP